MRLEHTCSICKKQNRYTSNVSTRGELQMKVGDEVEVSCNYCGEEDRKHINRIDAVVDQRKILIGLLIGIVIAIGSYFFLRGWGFLIIGIPIIIWYQEMNQVKDFNRYKIRRR